MNPLKRVYFILSFNTYHVSFKLNRVLFIEVYNVSSQHEILIVQTTCFIVKNRWFTVAKTKGEIQIWSYRYLRKAFFMFWQCRLSRSAKQLTNCIRTLHKLSHLKKYEKKDTLWRMISLLWKCVFIGCLLSLVGKLSNNCSLNSGNCYH